MGYPTKTAQQSGRGQSLEDILSLCLGRPWGTAYYLLPEFQIIDCRHTFHWQLKLPLLQLAFN